MKIGIIGTGAIGSLLAEKPSAAGHKVKVTNTRAMPELEKIAAGLGVTAASRYSRLLYRVEQRN